MKIITAILILWIHMVLVSVPLVFSMQLPTSDRAEEVFQRVKPLLENELIQLGLKWGAPVYIRIFKEEKLLEVWLKHFDRFILFKDYEICNYGPNGLGPKLMEGDKRAPEGFYWVSASDMNPNSNFHLSFNVGYPNSYDKAHGYTGGAIMVHGRCKSWGCYALSDTDVEEVYVLVEAGFKNGQAGVHVHVFPFRMTSENMWRSHGHLWESFWNNLKIGYDMFEHDGYHPPLVMVENKKYVFKSRNSRGYDFDPSAVVEHNLHIKVKSWFVPDAKLYFRRYFDNNVFEAVSPYKEEFTLFIEPVNQDFVRHHFVVRDQHGRVLEVGDQQETGWQSIESAPEGLRRLISRICKHHYH
ncbi:MAG: murein L,D-transpeptidase family protein [Desulfobacterales bacterium]